MSPFHYRRHWRTVNFSYLHYTVAITLVLESQDIHHFSGWTTQLLKEFHVYYRRVTDAASETAPQVVHTAGGVIIARLYSFTGVVTSGFPYNPQPAVGNTSGGTGSLVNGSSITTTIDQSLAIFFAAFEDDPTTFSTPSGWTPVSDRHGSSLGNDAAFAMFSKAMPTAGATGAVVTNLSGGTFSGNSPKGGIVFALSPIVVPGNRRARVSWIEFEISASTGTNRTI